MLKIYDTKEPRRIIKEQIPFTDIDSKWTFYYDETNNIRKFYVKENDFNESFHLSFVLGGIAFKGKTPDVDRLFDRIEFQKSVREIKLKHIATGDFFACLTSSKLNVFLNNLLASRFYIHIASINIFYFSIIDIVDSAIMNSKAAMQLGPDYGRFLKNNLYRVAKMEKESVVELFYAYGYPNIKKEDISGFIHSLGQLFEGYEDTFDFHVGLNSLKQILRESEKENSLPFLESGDDHILMKNFSGFYLRPIYTFKNSQHIFDKEESIQAIIGGYKITHGKKELKNYSFADSFGNKFLQASDIIVGLVGKFSTFINSKSLGEIVEYLLQMNELQLANFQLFLKIIDKAKAMNEAFLYSIESDDELQKYHRIRQILDSPE